MTLLSDLFPPPPSPFEAPSLLHSLTHSPLSFLLSTFHSLLLSLLPLPTSHPTFPVRIVCISDTHSLPLPTSLIPPGNLLIHAGDLTNTGRHAALQSAITQLSRLPHTHKIVIAGNHDSFLDPAVRHPDDLGKVLDWGGVHYLERNSVELSFKECGGRRLSVYGAPQIPACGGDDGDFAFQYERGKGNECWSGTVPLETDVLVTHTPSKWHLDLGGLGCEGLLRECWRIKPRVHVFGHVHVGAGRETVAWDGGQRAWEEVCARLARARGRVGLGELGDVRAWWGLGRCSWEGVKRLIWRRLWGGEMGKGTAKGEGWLVNAALMYRNTGRLGNQAQVVII